MVDQIFEEFFEEEGKINTMDVQKGVWNLFAQIGRFMDSKHKKCAPIVGWR